MQNYMDLLNNIYTELQEIIPVSNAVTFKITDCVSYYGRCKRTKTGFTVYISKYIKDEQCFKNTVAHELIHTCPACMNHGIIFQNLARKLKKYGYDIEVQSPITEEMKIAQQQKAKYEIGCVDGCFKEYKQRKINVDKYKCVHCGADLYIKEVPVK